MKCHSCGDPATGQCQTCWKFYCASHGDVLCEACKGSRERSPFSLQTTGLMSSVDLGDQNSPDGIELTDELRAALQFGFFRGEVLRGVLAVGQVIRTDRAELSLLSLESYADGFRMIFQVASTERLDPASLQFGGTHPNLLFGRVTDDSGTEHSGGFGGGGGGDRHWRAEANFTPAIADGAAGLTIRIEEIQWTSFAPNVRSSAEIGPWTFEISLAGMQSVTAI